MALILARAFVGACALDFALSPPSSLALPKFTSGRVGVTGHGNNGQSALIFAAFDERIGAVVGSSPGAPISSPYSYSSHNFYGEGPDAGAAGSWWLSGVANYTDNPDAMPMDGHGVLAMIAPRFAAIANAWNDFEGDSTFAVEKSVAVASQVYALVGAPKALRILHRPGGHHGFDSVPSYMDWFDYAFDRISTSPFQLSYAGDPPFGKQVYLTPAGFDWSTWNATFGVPAYTPQPPPPSAPLAKRISWVLQLGSTPMVPSTGAMSAEESVSGRMSWPSVMLDHVNHLLTIKRQPLSFGDYVTGTAYWPLGARAALPTVVWLHPYSYASGFSPTFGQSRVPEDLAALGFFVLAFDQIGFGSRLRDGGTTFYARHGGAASLFGHMVRDARAAVDLLTCLTATGRMMARCSTGEINTPSSPGIPASLPIVDGNKIVLAGYSLGGNVALHTAALDSRVTAVAAFAAFTPMRTDFEDRPSGGLRRLFETHALLPRLGFFAQSPSRVPYDYDDLLKAISPRPVLLHTPTRDRDANASEVNACIEQVKWDNLTQTTADTPTKMETAETEALISWLAQVVS